MEKINTPMDSLLEQLRFMVKVQTMNSRTDKFPYVCAEDFVLRHGKVYTPKPIPPKSNVWQYPTACFQCSYRAAVRNKSKWIYVEGFGMKPSLGLAFYHAWLTRADAPGVAFDPAWGYEHDAVYLGVPFRREYISKMHKVSKRQTFGVLDAPYAKWPLLAGEDDPSQVIHL